MLWLVIMKKDQTKILKNNMKDVFPEWFSILLLLLANACLNTLSAQKLNGTIKDKSGNPVPFATVYIQELRQGTTSNSKGFYEIRLVPGRYMVSYQSLGYEPLLEMISIENEDIAHNIILAEQIYDIPEVSISPSGEDPAYYIMRRVIGMAPYYLNYINYYKAEVYLKGNLVINRIPRIIERSMRMSSTEDNMSITAGGKSSGESQQIKEGDSFMMESFNEVEYTAPDKYVQRVISYNNSFPEQGNEFSPMQYIQASFYQPVLVDMAISPLSPQAFSHYNFSYQGVFLQGDYTVNRIAVMPKRKSQQLFMGTIYVIEDLWCLHSVDLTNENLAGTIRVRELYTPVEKEIWMPVSHQFDIALSIMGFRADAGYASSVKYSAVLPNDKLQKPEDIVAGLPPAGAVDTARSETSRKIEQILQKEELTNRDMVRLSKLTRKETENSRPDSAENILEIKDNTVRIIDKGAGKRDSAYWEEIRPIPLSEMERRSLQVRDSIISELATRNVQPSDTGVISVRSRKGAFMRSIGTVIEGRTWSDTTGLSFTYNGLVNPRSLSFNTVDGFIYGLDFRLNKAINRGATFSVYPEARYTFSREKLMWRINSDLAYGSMNRNRVYIRSGVISRDISSATGISPFLNSMTSLLLRENYMKLYESSFLTFGFETERKNGIKIEFSAGYENRKRLQNNSSFSIFRKDEEYTPNIPDNRYLTENNYNEILPELQKHFEFVTNVTFTPFQKYRVYNQKRIPMGSDKPVFSVTWKHGMNEKTFPGNGYRHYDMFRFQVTQERETGAFSEFRWTLRAGVFTDNRSLTFNDYFHFNTQPVELIFNDYSDDFKLPGYYSLSTPELFGEAHFRYTTPYLLLKLLPVLSNTLVRENLIFSFLGSRYNKTYTEIGYSLSEIFLLGEVGIFAGFDDLKYRSFGIRLALRFN